MDGVVKSEGGGGTGTVKNSSRSSRGNEAQTGQGSTALKLIQSLVTSAATLWLSPVGCEGLGVVLAGQGGSGHQTWNNRP